MDFSEIDSLAVNANLFFSNSNVCGSAVKPFFSGRRLICCSNSMIQLNAFGFGTPQWYPNTYMDVLILFNPNLSL